MKILNIKNTSTITILLVIFLSQMVFTTYFISYKKTFDIEISENGENESESESSVRLNTFIEEEIEHHEFEIYFKNNLTLNKKFLSIHYADFISIPFLEIKTPPPEIN